MTQDTAPPPFSDCGKTVPAVVVERRPDGAILLRHPDPIGPQARTVLSFLHRWAKETPDAPAFAQRSGAGWQERRYGELRQRVDAIAQALIDMGLSHGDRVMILSPASIAHAEIALATMTIGAIVVPVSPHYSLKPGGLERLRRIFDLVEPALLFVEAPAMFAAALGALGAGTRVIYAGDVDPAVGDGAVALDALTQAVPTPAVERAHAAIAPTDIAKLLFTSGTTGVPKGVINTHGMLTGNQAMLDAVEMSGGERADPDEPGPVIISWQPWHHTMAGNGYFNRTLRTGGAYYLDDGGPGGAGVERTAENLATLSPSSHTDVTIGWVALVEAMEADPPLAARFFARLTNIGFAAASLPEPLWQRLQTLAVQHTGMGIPVIGGYGSTETGPALMLAWWPTEGSGHLGLPLPGAEVKLVPLEDGRYDIRAKSPAVTPGYYRNADQTAAAFDEEGYLKLGDAVRIGDPGDPTLDLRFAGRTGEDFKLGTGTWVASGPLRARIGQRLDMVRDFVLTGLDRPGLGLLLWLDPARARAFCGSDAPAGDPRIISMIREALAAHNRENNATSTRIDRFRIMDRPLSMSEGEISDKGSVNQIITLRTRAEAIEELYGDAPSPPSYRVQS